MSTDHDVVVTGIGATTPIGRRRVGTWHAMLAGRSASCPHRAVGRKYELPVRIDAQLAVEPSEVLHRVGPSPGPVPAGRADRRPGGLGGRRRPRPRPGAARRHRRLRHRRCHHPARPGRHPGGVRATPGLAAHRADADAERSGRRVGLELGARAGVHSAASACATGAEAIALGAGHDPLRPGRRGGGRRHRGRASTRCRSPASPDAGHVDAQRRPGRASRPCDKGRDGFVLGEGAGIVVLERAEHAAARGARVYARLAGAGITSDAYDIAQPHAEGEGAIRAIAQGARRRRTRHAGHRARQRARHLDPGRATCGDRRAPRRRSATTRCCTATKSMTGHLLGAAGALESIATILAIRDSVVPADDQPRRPRTTRPITPAMSPRTRPATWHIPAALNNSFGFGGHNVALVVHRA